MLGFLLSPHGRVSRKGYWLGWILPSATLTVVSSVIDAAMGDGGTGVASLLTTLLTFWPNLAITVKRYHDHGRSGWWFLWSIVIVCLLFVPAAAAIESLALHNIVWPWVVTWISFYAAGFAVIAFTLIVYFLPGDIGANRFGGDPLGPRKPKKPRKDPAIEFPGPWTNAATRRDRPWPDSPSHMSERPSPPR